MAHRIEFADGSQTSSNFYPKTGFQISVHGTTAQNYEVKTLPEEEPDSGDWLDAEVVTATKTLSTGNPLVIVNFASGYKYRLEGETGNVDSNLRFYFGNATTTKFGFG